MAQPIEIPKKSRLSEYKKFYPLYLLALPGLVYLFINNYLPMFGLVIAFKNIDYSKGILGSPWVGLQNFKYLFATSDAYIITRNTLLYNVAFILINTVVAIAIAIMLNEVQNRFLKSFYQSVVLLPFLISMVVVSYLVYAGLSTQSGFINNSILKPLHIAPISWYAESKYWPFILPIINVWKGMGFLCVIYLSSIIGIDKEYYEAARLDGASIGQQIRFITLPLIKPVVVTMVILAIGRIFYSDFGLFYQVPMNSGALYDTTNVIDTYVYRGLLQLGDVGMSSAAGFYQSLVGFVLVLLSNYVVKKISKDQALF